MVDFMVIKIPSAYNVLLRRPNQNALRVVGSSPHLKVKFPTPYGIGEVRGDQQVARQCYNTIVKLKGKKSELVEITREKSNLNGVIRFMDVQRRP